MKFKTKPEDFVVKEIYDKMPIQGDKEGEYAIALMTKTDWTTSRAIQQISRRLRVSRVRIGFSGNKDKNAITSQLISLWHIKKEQIERTKIKDIELKFLGYNDERLTLGNHKINHFEIRLRSLTKKELETFESRVELVKREGFPNYFGAQRFGMSGNSHLIGKQIVKGDFEKAVKRLLGKNPGKNWKRQLEKLPKGRRMEKAVLNHLVKLPTDYANALRQIEKPTRRIFVHAYQSWLFNKALSEILAKDSEKVEFLDLSLSFPNNSVKIKEVLALPGTKIKLNQDKFSKAYAHVLKDEGIKPEDFKCPRMPELESEGTERLSFVKAENLKWKKAGKEGRSLILSFDLPKGCYATMLLSALFLENIK